MNLLLLEPEEIDAYGEATVTGTRAKHLIDVLGVQPGQSVRAGVVDGGLGRADVRAVEAGRVRLALRLGEVPEPPPLDLLLAVPRPKVLKRLWAPIASLGVGRVWLTNAEKVERFYFDSHAVRPETYRPRLLEGLAQARDTRVPVVEVHKSLKALVEDRIEPLDARRVLADPEFDRGAYETVAGTSPGRRVILALGPEGGWSAYERDLFLRHGFVGVGMGPRVLRLDTAVVALLAMAHEALRSR
ncbi:MAG: RsmE family RNA methyltransferase [Sandaracinaceae bacterium]